MTPKKILVTGGAGYIGAHCCRKLSERGLEPVVMDNFSTGHREFVKWGQLFEGDIRSPADLTACFGQHRPEAVLHFAGFIEVGESVKDPGKYYENNVAGSLQLLKAAAAHGVEQFIFSSSAAVYGQPEKVPIGEDHRLFPVSPYGWTKLMVEKMLADFEIAHGMRWAALRYFNAAGAADSGAIGEKHEPESHLIPRILQAAVDGRKVSIFGTDYPTADGTCIRDYIHVEDLVDAHLLAIDYLAAGGPSDAFNLGRGRGYSVRQVIDTASAVTGFDIAFVEVDRRPGDPPELVAASGKAGDLLGWKPGASGLENIISSAWRWHQKIAAS